MEVNVPWICTPCDPETKTKSANIGTRRDACCGVGHLLDVTREELELRKTAPSTAIGSPLSCACEKSIHSVYTFGTESISATVALVRPFNPYRYTSWGQ